MFYTFLCPLQCSATQWLCQPKALPACLSQGWFFFTGSFFQNSQYQIRSSTETEQRVSLKKFSIAVVATACYPMVFEHLHRGLISVP